MGIYAIHAQQPAGGREGLESVRSVRSGFSLGALVFGPLWLLTRGLWAAFAVYAIATIVMSALAGFGFLTPAALLGLYALAAFYLGLEGNAWRTASLERAGLPLADVVIEDDALRAEHAFLVRALARFPSAGAARSAGARPDTGIIGLFPERGR